MASWLWLLYLVLGAIIGSLGYDLVVRLMARYNLDPLAKVGLAELDEWVLEAQSDYRHSFINQKLNMEVMKHRSSASFDWDIDVKIGALILTDMNMYSRWHMYHVLRDYTKHMIAQELIKQIEEKKLELT